MKKVKMNLLSNRTFIKNRNKSERRSLHAMNRKRDSDGKFKSRPDNTNDEDLDVIHEEDEVESKDGENELMVANTKE